MQNINKLWISWVFLMVAFSLTVNAWTLSHYSLNAYDFSPISYVYVVAYNNDTNTTLGEGFSDLNGLMEFTITDAGNYTFTAVKPGYNQRNLSFEVTDDQITYAYLTYDSTSFVKFSFSDMTAIKHDWCFYYGTNGRLIDCYSENDTVHLIDQMNYTVYPKLSMLEQAGLLSTSTGFLTQIFIYLLIGFFLISGIVVTLVMIIMGVRVLKR